MSRLKLEEARGHWALITGASSGIGREFSRQLAGAGMNVVLLARRKLLLDSLAIELSRRHGVQARMLSVDLTKIADFTNIKSHLAAADIKIRLLVNNAAFGRWGHFDAQPFSVYEEMIRLNNVTMVALCHNFLDDLISFPTSAIINVSSQAAYNPIPYMAVYAATKAFASSFSQAMYGEWKDRGVYVQTLVPRPTETEFDAVAGVHVSAIGERGNVEDVVRASLSHLDSDKPVVTNAKGIFKQRLFAGLFPVRMVINTVGRMFHPPSTRNVKQKQKI